MAAGVRSASRRSSLACRIVRVRNCVTVEEDRSKAFFHQSCNPAAVPCQPAYGLVSCFMRKENAMDTSTSSPKLIPRASRPDDEAASPESEKLDEELEQSFPASDAPTVTRDRG